VPCSPSTTKSGNFAPNSRPRGRAQAEEDLKRLIAEQAKFDRAFDVAEKRRPVSSSRSASLGRPVTPRSVTATMFTPYSHTPAARHIAQFVDLCKASSRPKGDPNRCAIAAYHGSWERPDSGFADRVLATAAKGDAPDFEMPASHKVCSPPGKSHRAGFGCGYLPSTPRRDSREHGRMQQCTSIM
jgi:hypothetical protein